MNLKELKLFPANINSAGNTNNFYAVDARTSAQYPAVVVVSAPRGAKQNVKILSDCNELIMKLQKDLDAGKRVKVKFSGLIIKAYAMMRDGKVLDGISASAESFEIISAEVDDDVQIDL